jgi:hypothetical protein
MGIESMMITAPTFDPLGNHFPLQILKRMSELRKENDRFKYGQYLKKFLTEYPKILRQSDGPKSQIDLYSLRNTYANLILSACDYSTHPTTLIQARVRVKRDLKDYFDDSTIFLAESMASYLFEAVKIKPNNFKKKNIDEGILISQVASLHDRYMKRISIAPELQKILKDLKIENFVSSLQVRTHKDLLGLLSQVGSYLKGRSEHLINLSNSRKPIPLVPSIFAYKSDTLPIFAEREIVALHNNLVVIQHSDLGNHPENHAQTIQFLENVGSIIGRISKAASRRTDRSISDDELRELSKCLEYLKIIP